MDLDSAFFMMLTEDFPTLFGIMMKLANCKVKMHDLFEFNDWLHVIFDLIMVKIYIGRTDEERKEFNDILLYILRVMFGMTLTTHIDSLIVFKN